MGGGGGVLEDVQPWWVRPCDEQPLMSQTNPGNYGNVITFQVLLFALAKPPLEKSLEKAFLILCEVTPPSVFAALVDSHHGVSD